MKLINAEVKDINPENSTFNVLLSFPFGYKQIINTLIFCRLEGNTVKAYNVGIMGGKCPCCFKPTCTNIFAKRHELLVESQNFIELPVDGLKNNSK